jgi:hypothetical protein
MRATEKYAHWRVAAALRCASNRALMALHAWGWTVLNGLRFVEIGDGSFQFFSQGWNIALNDLPDNIQAASYGNSFRQHLLAKRCGKKLRRAKVHLDAERSLHLQLQFGKIQKAGLGRGIDEEIEIAVVGIFAAKNGTEETRVRHAGSQYHAADCVTVLRQNL